MCRKADPVSHAPSHPSAFGTPPQKRPSGHFPASSWRYRFLFQGFAAKKTVTGARTVTVSDEMGLRNGEGRR